MKRVDEVKRRGKTAVETEARQLKQEIAQEVEELEGQRDRLQETLRLRDHEAAELRQRIVDLQQQLEETGDNYDDLKAAHQRLIAQVNEGVYESQPVAEQDRTLIGEQQRDLGVYQGIVEHWETTTGQHPEPDTTLLSRLTGLFGAALAFRPLQEEHDKLKATHEDNLTYFNRKIADLERQLTSSRPLLENKAEAWGNMRAANVHLEKKLSEQGQVIDQLHGELARIQAHPTPEASTNEDVDRLIKMVHLLGEVVVLAE